MFIKAIVKNTIDELPKAIANVLSVTTIGSVVTGIILIRAKIWQTLLTHISSSYVAIIFLISLMVAVCSLTTLIYIQFRKQKKLILRYGVLWDENLNPHCSTCKNPLHTQNVEVFGVVTYQCSKCKTNVKFSDENGKLLPYQAVLKEIRIVLDSYNQRSIKTPLIKR